MEQAIILSDYIQFQLFLYAPPGLYVSTLKYSTIKNVI